MAKARTGWPHKSRQALQLRYRSGCSRETSQSRLDWFSRRGHDLMRCETQCTGEVVAALNEIQSASRKERKRAALAQTRENLRDLPVIAQNTVATFVEQVQERCPTLSERDLFRTADIFAKMERARSGFDLLKQIQECSPDDIDTWMQSCRSGLRVMLNSY